tara:strand:- start:34330 stop:35802 length:1473 start_codon:yes stop_codon:yes gene_type:complete
MTIGFNEVPSSIRVPFLYAEFDNTGAQQGSNQQPYRVMMMGPKIAAGSADAEKIYQIDSGASQVDSLFGQGSLLASMIKSFREVNTLNELYVIPVDDDVASVAATGSIEITASPTKAGVLAFYVAGKRVAISVAAAQSTDSIASDLQAAIAANADLLVSAAVDGGNASLVNLTAKNKGITGNDIDLRVNFSADDETPESLIEVITAMSGGVGQPDLSNAIAALDDKQYIFFVCPFNDAISIAALEQELTGRFGPLKQNDGYCFYYYVGTLSEQTTFGNSKNSQFTMVLDALGPEHGASQISRVAARVCQAGEIDPGRPFQTLEVLGMDVPSQEEQRSLEDRNTLLFNGIFTLKVVANRVVIERVITTYKVNNAGAADISYLDLNTLLTLSYLRYDWRNYMLGKYPRHKLANDGTRFSEGQPVMTPGLGKAEAIQRFRLWEFNGLVEGVDQFKEQLIVERNQADPNRLDFLLPPDLINQLRVMGVQFKFLL